MTSDAEKLFVAHRLELLGQQRQLICQALNHYVDKVISEGKAWAETQAGSKMTFSEICQIVNSATEFLRLMCEEMPDAVRKKKLSLVAVGSRHNQVKAGVSSSGDHMTFICEVPQAEDKMPCQGDGLLKMTDNVSHCNEETLDYSEELFQNEKMQCLDNMSLQSQVDMVNDKVLLFNGEGNPDYDKVSFRNEEKPTCDKMAFLSEKFKQTLEEEICDNKLHSFACGRNLQNILHNNQQIYIDETSFNKSNVPCAVLTRTGKQMSKCMRVKQRKIFKCDVCGEGFADKDHLMTHRSSQHAGEKLYDICSKSLIHPRHLKKRRKGHLDEKTYRCNVFNQADNLQQNKQSEDKPYKCEMCGVKFRKGSRLKIHLAVHSEEKPYICDVYGVGFRYNSNLGVHKRKHTGEKPYKCDVCHVGFPRWDALKAHIITHTGDKPYKCDVCDYGSDRKSSLDNHKRIHSGERPFKCDCGAQFSQLSHLNRHKQVHTGEKPYRCVVCGMAFGYNSDLRVHKIVHTGDTPYKCHVCDVEFTQICALQKHKLEHVEQSLKHNIYSFGFPELTNFQNNGRKHVRSKPFVCDVCGLSFTKISVLHIHKKKHVEEKPFKCDVCGAAYSQISGLQIHERKHTGEKPLLCDVCGDSFAQKCILKTHRRKHMGEKPYVCNVCSVSFACGSNLRRHEKKHSQPDYADVEPVVNNWDAEKSHLVLGV